MKAGDIVSIYNKTIGGEDILEGEAKLIKPSDIDNGGLNDGFELWQIEFTDQLGEYFDRIIKQD